MKEIWKEINLYGTEYLINNMGVIKNKKRDKILKPYISSGGYEYIKILKQHRHYHIRIHRLVAQTFIPNPNNLPQVNHIDGNKLNNNVENLEWVSCSQNVVHGFKNGLYNIKRINKTKVNQYDLQGNFIKTWDSISEIEKEYNVTHTAIRFCCLNKIKTCKGYIWRYANK